MSALPNVLYIGPDKAGSTWLAKALSLHTDVFVAPSKDIYFFDRYWNRGVEWYSRHFAGATGEAIIAELSHDYLFDQRAPKRIADTLGDVRLLVHLRNPVDRAFSAFLYWRKLGLVAGDFSDVWRSNGHLRNSSLYACHLSSYLQTFSNSNIWFGDFDQLRQDGQNYIERLFQWLEVEPQGVDVARAADAKLSAGEARIPIVANMAKRTAALLRARGLGEIVGRAKRTSWFQRLLFRPYQGDERPRISEVDADLVFRFCEKDIEELDSIIGSDYVNRWRPRGADQ